MKNLENLGKQYGFELVRHTNSDLIFEVAAKESSIYVGVITFAKTDNNDFEVFFEDFGPDNSLTQDIIEFTMNVFKELNK